MKRGHRYAVRLDLGRGPDGKRIFKWHSGYTTKRAAQQARTELLGALEQATYIPPDTTTPAQYLRQQWLPAAKHQVRPGTWSEYCSKAERHLIPAIGQVNLQKLTTAMLNALYTQLLERGTGARTVQYVHATIRKALNDAVRWGLLVRNPALHATHPSTTAASCKPGPPSSCAASSTASKGSGWPRRGPRATLGRRRPRRRLPVGPPDTGHRRPHGPGLPAQNRPRTAADRP